MDKDKDRIDTCKELKSLNEAIKKKLDLMINREKSRYQDDDLGLLDIITPEKEDNNI